VSLSRIDAVFAAGDVVSPKTLVEKKVINVRGKKFPKVKVLANGEITKKVTIENCLVSASAKAAIEKAGGNVAE
jgi:large subunit ribosomal protein L15